MNTEPLDAMGAAESKSRTIIHYKKSLAKYQTLKIFIFLCWFRTIIVKVMFVNKKNSDLPPKQVSTVSQYIVAVSTGDPRVWCSNIAFHMPKNKKDLLVD